MSDGSPARHCPKCDQVIAEGARACPNCGWLVVRRPLELQADDGVSKFFGFVFCVGLGCVGGLVGGVFVWSWLAELLSTISPAPHVPGDVSPSLAWNWWVGLIMVGCQAAATVPCLLGGRGLLRRGHRALALLVISFGICLALPAAACDVGYISERPTKDARNASLTPLHSRGQSANILGAGSNLPRVLIAPSSFQVSQEDSS